jgi:hypothetical protein
MIINTKGVELNENVYVNKEGNAKDTFKMQPNELIYSQFVFDFLNLKSSKDSDKSKNEISGAIAVQPDIYSDKSNIWLSWIGGIFFASAPLLIYYSQEARAYEVAAMFGMWSMVTFYELFLLKKEKKTLEYILEQS